MWRKTIPLGISINPANADSELEKFRNLINDEIIELSDIFKGKIHTVEEQTKILQDMVCVGCTDYEMTTFMFKSIFENAINNPECEQCLTEGKCALGEVCPKSCKIAEAFGDKPQDCQLLQLPGDVNHYGKFAFIYYTYGMDLTTKSYNTSQRPLIKIAALALRQHCMEKACLFLKDYITFFKIKFSPL